MAKHIKITLTDDIDGSDAVETVKFAIDGRAYEIDLSEANATAIRSALAPFIEAGRKQQGTRVTRTLSKGAVDYDAKAVRAWAQANAVEVPKRGRIPFAVIEQYRAAGY